MRSAWGGGVEEDDRRKKRGRGGGGVCTVSVHSGVVLCQADKHKRTECDVLEIVLTLCVRRLHCAATPHFLGQGRS